MGGLGGVGVGIGPTGWVWGGPLGSGVWREEGEAEGCGGGSQGAIQGGQGEAAAVGEFEIGGVVDREGEAFGQGGGLGPGAGGGFVIERDGEVLEEGREGGALFRGEAAAAFGHEEAVQGFEGPEEGGDGAGFGDAIEEREDFGGLFILEAPGEGDGIVENEGQERPSSKRVLRGMPPRVAPWLAARRPAAARRAFSRSKAGPAGTSLATGMPWRVMVISAPRST